MDADVIILGGGCGGLWLLHEISKRNHRAVLIEHGRQLGLFASTRGQNRLHNGLIYAMTNARGKGPTIEACIAGNAAIKEFCSNHAPDALGAGGPPQDCLYLFRFEKDFEKACRNLAAFPSIAPRFLEGIPLAERRMADRLLHGSEFKYGILTNEFAFNSHRILKALADLSVQLGGKIVNTEQPLGQLSFSRVGDKWSIHEKEMLICTGKIVVCATGVQNFQLRDHIMHELGAATLEIPDEIIKSTDASFIAVFHKQLCEGILVVQQGREPRFLALMPVEGATTITSGRPFDTSLGPNEFLRLLGRDLGRFFPNLEHFNACGAHVYTCEKLDNSNATGNSRPLDEYGWRHYFWFRFLEDKSLILYTPGKFTLAPIGAQALSDEILDGIDIEPAIQMEIGSHVSQIATRACYDSPTHVALPRKGRTVVFDPLAG